MYAVVETGGKQYRVSPGDVVRIEKLDVEAGEEVIFSRVLMIAADGTVTVGKPMVLGGSVVGTVLGHDKAKKIYVFRYKAKKHERKKTGHRQPFTSVRIQSIAGA
ncbi:MAG: 50S ribosomal protein L21 [Clostridia bacterium]|nr:50S ribosomal protein L21 [Clostridia bacterium]